MARLFTFTPPASRCFSFFFSWCHARSAWCSPSEITKTEKLATRCLGHLRPVSKHSSTILLCHERTPISHSHGQRQGGVPAAAQPERAALVPRGPLRGGHLAHLAAELVAEAAGAAGVDRSNAARQPRRHPRARSTWTRPAAPFPSDGVGRRACTPCASRSSARRARRCSRRSPCTTPSAARARISRSRCSPCRGTFACRAGT